MDYLDYFHRFKKMQRWISNDLTKSSIHAQANFLVAMGVFNYIEILGSFYEFQGSSTRRFDYAFQSLFPTPYSILFDQIQLITNRGAYDCLRCGMTHEYLIKTYPINEKTNQVSFTIVGISDQAGFDHVVTSLSCGLVLHSNGNKYHIDIYNPRLIHDLDLAFEVYKESLISDHMDYRARFMARCQTIHLEDFN